MSLTEMAKKKKLPTVCGRVSTAVELCCATALL